MKLKIIIPTLLLIIILSACTQPGAAASIVKQPSIIQQSGTTGKLTEEEATSIALIHASFTADQVKQLRLEFEYDDGIPQYNVEFYEGYLEYEYEIHAVTGQILSVEKDD